MHQLLKHELEYYKERCINIEIIPHQQTLQLDP